jgi:cation diffusion facilitator CzcD-associated flavoprotein CzcO
VKVNHAAVESEKTKFLIVGAGIGGIMWAVKLLKAGFKVEDIVIVDRAGGFGGTW